MAVTIQFRRGTAASATSNNPILLAGEPGFETDTGLFKVGDGVTAWNSLPYAGGGGGGPAIAEVYANIAAMLADQSNQEENAYYWVTDATTDGTVTSGWAIYRKLAVSTAALGDYVKVQEQESLEIVATPDASETVKGKGELLDQTESETIATSATSAGADHTRIVSGRGLWWFWAKIKTLTQTISGVWTFGASPLVPNLTVGDNSGKAANTKYVDDSIATVSAYASTPPFIVFAAIVGQTMKTKTLTLTKVFRDIDGPVEGATTYQWVRANDAIGTGKTNISGATSSSYTLDTAEVTKYVACEITPVNAASEAGLLYRTAYVGVIEDVLYPGSLASTIIAMGCKKIISAYVGSGIRVQSSNGGTTTNIGFDVNGELDWAAVAAHGVTYGVPVYLNRMFDQSGSAYDMTFASFAVQPEVDYVNRRIKMVATKAPIITHNAAMNIGIGDFTTFLEYAQRTMSDSTFTFFCKKTSFSANNLQMYSNSGYGITMYTGNAGGVNTLVAPYHTPDKMNVTAMYRNSTTKYIATDDVVKSAAEVATDLTSTVNILFNSGDGGDGDWYFRTFIYCLTNNGSSLASVKKFLS